MVDYSTCPFGVAGEITALAQGICRKRRTKSLVFSFSTDRILMRKGEIQIYGSQSLWDKTEKKNFIYPLEDYKTVNECRIELGLETIEEAAKRDGCVYAIERM